MTPPEDYEFGCLAPLVYIAVLVVSLVVFIDWSMSRDN